MAKVETYEVLGVEADREGNPVNEPVSEEAMALIESLELEGQRELLCPKTEGGVETITRNPYRIMTLEEMRVFRAVCGQVTQLHAYRDGAIPLRVLQVAAHAKGLFERLEVWHPESSRDDDPVLVGVLTNPKNTWAKDHFLLARWGDVLVSFDELRIMAAAKLRPSWLLKVTELRREVDAFMADLDIHLDAHLRGTIVHAPTASLPA